MRPEELLPDIARRWWIILLAALSAAVAGYVFASTQPDEYTVSARLAASAEPADYYLDLYAKNRLSSIRPLITTSAFVQSALADANLTIDPGEALGKLGISHNTSNNTLSITVTDSDGQRAAGIANAMQMAIIAWNDEQNESLIARSTSDQVPFPGRVVLIPLESAGVPGAPDSPAVRSTTLAAGLLGAVAGCVIIFFLMYRDDTLKTERDVERELGRPLLAVLPAERSW